MNALQTIEEIYSLALNPELDYYAQLEPLAANGELASHNSSMKVLFKLAMIVDAQAKEIQGLKERLEVRDAAPTDQTRLDPTQPIQS